MPILKLIFLAWLLTPINSRAFESILSYDSDINIATNSTIAVTDTVVVRAEGVRIKHGIRRDFITDYRSPNHQYQTGLKILSILRNGVPEPYRLKKIRHGFRMFTGDSDHYLEPGIHTFTLRYRISRGIRFFPDHDAFFWRIDRRNWSLPILKSKTTVYLPDAIATQAVKLQRYPKNNAPQNSRIVKTGSGTALFESTDGLQTNDVTGFSLTFPKNVIKQPNDIAKIHILLDESPDLAILLTGITFCLGCYLITVFLAKNTKPRKAENSSMPVTHFSPATLGLIGNENYNNRTLISAIINLAIKGHINIEEGAKGKFVINKRLSSKKPAFDEQVLLYRLFSDERPFVELNPHNRRTIEKTISIHRLATQITYFKHLISSRPALQLPGILVLILTLVSAQLTLEHQLHMDVNRPLIALLFCWTLAATAMLWKTFRLWKRLSAQPSRQACKPCLLATLFALFMLAGEFIGIQLTLETTTVNFAAGLIVLALINDYFIRRLNSPDLLGKILINKANHFRLFLCSDPENDSNANKSVKLFEHYLAYALALNLEREWSRRFMEQASSISVDGDNQPRWRHSHHARQQSYAEIAVTTCQNIDLTVSALLKP